MRLREPPRRVADRDGQGPVQARCEVLAHRRDGAYHELSVASPEIAARARPGQFITVATGAQSCLLRRPFSIAGVTRNGPAAGTVEIVFDVYGQATAWLAEREIHEQIDVVGPLGTAFPLPRRPVTCLLVGGGYGVAPLLFLGEALSDAGMRIDMIVGADTKDGLYNTIEAKRLTARIAFTTEDGSLGQRGRVTDVFDDMLERSGAVVVYACGPMPMLRTVAEACADRDLPCRVAVEERMACGTGVCWTCVVPTRQRSGGIRMARACVEGPVFDAARIAWEESRW